MRRGEKPHRYRIQMCGRYLRCTRQQLGGKGLKNAHPMPDLDNTQHKIIITQQDATARTMKRILLEGDKEERKRHKQEVMAEADQMTALASLVQTSRNAQTAIQQPAATCTVNAASVTANDDNGDGDQSGNQSSNPTIDDRVTEQGAFLNQQGNRLVRCPARGMSEDHNGEVSKSVVPTHAEGLLAFHSCSDHTSVLRSFVLLLIYGF